VVLVPDRNIERAIGPGFALVQSTALEIGIDGELRILATWVVGLGSNCGAAAQSQ
jgi:hypothetical protein